MNPQAGGFQADTEPAKPKNIDLRGGLTINFLSLAMLPEVPVCRVGGQAAEVLAAGSEAGEVSLLLTRHL